MVYMCVTASRKLKSKNTRSSRSPRPAPSAPPAMFEFVSSTVAFSAGVAQSAGKRENRDWDTMYCIVGFGGTPSPAEMRKR